MLNKFKEDVIEGLSKSPQKTLPSKYFYDQKGDALFMQIMKMPEYYLTRAEMDIFKNKTDALIDALDMDGSATYEIIELGAGDGSKTVHLLAALLERGYRFTYVPVDISQNVLNLLTARINRELPKLHVSPQNGDYFDILNSLHQNKKQKVVLFLGSNIGNLMDKRAAQFVYKLGSSLVKNDKMVLGVDLIKAKEIVLPAYNDAQGITAAFNLNLLDRINRELNGNFNREYFEHTAYYDEQEGIAKSYIRSTQKQTVTIDNQDFNFEKGESIHTEISRKYNDEIINDILKDTDITVLHKVLDSNELFADYILIRN